MSYYISIDNFNNLFIAAIRRACGAEEIDINSLKFLLANISDKNLSTFEDVSRMLYGDGLKFNFVIDVGFYGENVLFIRWSNHEKVDFKDTFDPSDLGPFHSIGKMGGI